MATDTKSKGQEVPDAAAAGGGATAGPAMWTTPIVFARAGSGGGKKKRKKKYTRGTGPFQRLILGFARAGFRTTNSVSKGLRTFVRRSNRSARRKRDGMVRDVFRNASRGFADGARELGKAPRDFSRQVRTGRVWRTFRVFTPFAR